MRLASLAVVWCACAGGLVQSSAAGNSWRPAPELMELTRSAPKLAKALMRAAEEPAILAAELARDPMAQLAPTLPSVGEPRSNSNGTPIVVTHGMGDSCFNDGMKSVTKAAGDHAGVYSVCVPGGRTAASDTLSGFFTTMNKNVDIFAEKVREDGKLAQGFNAIGLSQGNSVIRGYIQRYNDPPVLNYLSIHGTIMGVAGFPNCNPKGLLGPVCDILAESLGRLAYSKTIQNFLFQANYFRDPTRVGTEAYLNNSQIAGWNNENPAKVNSTYKSNFEAVHSYSMIKAERDTMVFPNAGEWWGQFAPGQFKKVQAMNETTLYARDSFGLKSVAQAKKINFNSTKGEHLQFTIEELSGWIDMYWH